MSWLYYITSGVRNHHGLRSKDGAENRKQLYICAHGVVMQRLLYLPYFSRDETNKIDVDHLEVGFLSENPNGGDDTGSSYMAAILIADKK